MELNTNRSMLHPEQGSQAIVMTHEHSIPSLHTSNKRTARNWYSNKNTKCCAQHTVPVIKTLSSILPCWQCYWFVSLWLQLLNEGWFFKDKVLGVLCSKVYFANRNFMPTGCTLLVLHCKGYVFCFCVFFQSSYSHLYICIFKSGYQKMRVSQHHRKSIIMVTGVVAQVHWVCTYVPMVCWVMHCRGVWRDQVWVVYLQPLLPFDFRQLLEGVLMQECKRWGCWWPKRPS